MKVGTGVRTKLNALCQIATEELLPAQAHPGTARRWFNHYLQYGETPHETDKWKRRTYVGRKRRLWTLHDSQTLQNIVDQKPWLFLDEIVEELAKVKNHYWDPSLVWKKLKEECNYSLQVATETAFQMNEEDRAQYLEAVEAAAFNPEMLLYLDESQKDRNSARRRRWWARRGRTPFRTAYFEGNRGVRYSLIAACDVNGFIKETCDIVRRGRSHDEEEMDPTIGTVDQDRFELWVQEKLLDANVLGSYARREAHSIVVLDNASIHHSQKIIDLITSMGAIVIYTAPYSPDLNPIELMFGRYKTALKRFEGMPWLQAHLSALDSVTPAMARAFFCHSQVPGCGHFETMVEAEKSRKRNFFLVAGCTETQKVAQSALQTVMVGVAVAAKCRRHL